MKIFISADIEGVAGIHHWNETTKHHEEYLPIQTQMTKEVKAACEGANLAGATEIWVKDAHNDGRNIHLIELPLNTRLIRGKSGHPFRMMQELDSTFDAVLLIGYHSHACSGENPLSHTFHRNIASMKINGEYASEFLVNAYIASYVGVPILFISGDHGICLQAKKFNDNISYVQTNKGIGNSTICFHPDSIVHQIKSSVENILSRKNKENIIQTHPKTFHIEITFIEHHKAYKNSFYPNAKSLSANTIQFQTDNYFEVLRMFSFII
jgi:D-amino peptidase